MSVDVKLNMLNALRWLGAYTIAAVLGAVTLGLGVVVLIDADLPIISNGVIATGNDFGRLILALTENRFLMLALVTAWTLVLVMPVALFVFALTEVMGVKPSRSNYATVGTVGGLIGYTVYEWPTNYITLQSTVWNGWTSYVPVAVGGMVIGFSLAQLRKSWLKPLRDLPRSP